MGLWPIVLRCIYIAHVTYSSMTRTQVLDGALQLLAITHMGATLL
jgi:hypothetical protein